ncbi:MAG: hypothetical protein GX240_06460 [Candidatus Atribacteria bacterium]|nr:hypothetical protein [Candidatus Atribacteria bacterium]
MFAILLIGGALLAIVYQDAIQRNLKHAISRDYLSLEKIFGTVCFLIGIDISKTKVTVSINPASWQILPKPLIVPPWKVS